MDANMKQLRRSKEKLHPKDNEFQTFGCRHTNPDICSNNSLPGICAFTSDDCICKKPPRSWKKLFAVLKENKKK